MRRIFIAVISMALGMAVAEEAAKAKPGKGKRPSIAEGKKTYQKSCMACHGEKGKGDGPAAMALRPKPRNFTDTARISKEPTAKLWGVISEGGPKYGFSPLMASWKKMLKPEQIDNVLAYVLTFSSDSAKAVTRVMDKDKEAAGEEKEGKTSSKPVEKVGEKTENADKSAN